MKHLQDTGVVKRVGPNKGGHWSCYLHACFMYIEGKTLTNKSLRDRFNMNDYSAGSISRLIKESVSEVQIKPLDSETAKRYMKYIPAWA